MFDVISIEDKYEIIDKILEDIQLGLPSDDGEGFIWVAASREDNVIIYEYMASKDFDGSYNHEDEKFLIINRIKNEPLVVADQMCFSFIYNLPGEKIDIINVSPEDYN